MNTSAWNGTINTTYADTYLKPYYQTIVPFTDCYGKNGGRVDHLLSAQNYIPTQPIRKIIVTSAGNLTIKLVDGSVMTRRWKSETTIDNIIVTAIMSAGGGSSSASAKGIYPLW
jgi:hypothetical protein